MRDRVFKPVTPRDVKAALAGRTFAHSVLHYDAGSFVHLPCPRDGKLNFYYTRSDWSEGVSWAEFKVNGHVFRRRVRCVQVGNSGCSWVRIAGKDYQISEDYGRTQ